MKKKKRKVAKMRLQVERTQAEIEWHESHFPISDQKRAQRDQYLESLVQDITSGTEDSDEE